jgi:hypothetical protein
MGTKTASGLYAPAVLEEPTVYPAPFAQGLSDHDAASLPLRDTPITVYKKAADSMWEARINADWTLRPTRSGDPGAVLNDASAALAAANGGTCRLFGQAGATTPVEVGTGVVLEGDGYSKAKSVADGGSMHHSTLFADIGFPVDQDLLTVAGYFGGARQLDLDGMGRCARVYVATDPGIQSLHAEFLGVRGGIDYAAFFDGVDQIMLWGGEYHGGDKGIIHAVSGSDSQMVGVYVFGDFTSSGHANQYGPVYLGGSTWQITGGHWSVGGTATPEANPDGTNTIWNGGSPIPIGAGIILDGDRNIIRGTILDSGPAGPSPNCVLWNRSDRNTIDVEFFYNTGGGVSAGDAIRHSSGKKLGLMAAITHLGDNPVGGFNYGVFKDDHTPAGGAVGKMAVYHFDGNNIGQSALWNVAPDSHHGNWLNGVPVD